MSTDDPKAGGNNLLSSYLGRWISIAIFVLIILIAAAALFLEPDYPAHVPLRIGICAFDSAAAAPVLDSFAAAVREREGGDIDWVWLKRDAGPGECEFYIMTAIQLLRDEDRSPSECLLIATSREDGQLPRGAVITARGRAPGWSPMAFTSALSSSGFLSPLSALAENGIPPGDVSPVSLSNGCPVCGEAVAIGVALGRFDAGGLPLGELRRLEESSIISQGSVDVILTGPALPEILLVCDESTESWKSRGFAGRLPEIASGLPLPLRREMRRLGMAAFRAPREGELDIEDAVDRSALEALRHHYP
jgi:hypothetical protein